MVIDVSEVFCFNVLWIYITLKVLSMEIEEKGENSLGRIVWVNLCERVEKIKKTMMVLLFFHYCFVLLQFFVMLYPE